MKLTAEQYDAYIRDGFLVFPELFDEAEVNILRNEADRLRQIDAEGIFREGNDGMAKTMFRMHEPDGPTFSPAYRALSRTPKIFRYCAAIIARRKFIYASLQT